MKKPICILVSGTDCIMTAIVPIEDAEPSGEDVGEWEPECVICKCKLEDETKLLRITCCAKPFYLHDGCLETCMERGVDCPDT